MITILQRRGIQRLLKCSILALTIVIQQIEYDSAFNYLLGVPPVFHSAFYSLAIKLSLQ